jgi:hypothetical protein
MATSTLNFPPCSATTSVPVEEAREHFIDRFMQACYPSTLSARATTQLDSIFDRTARYAMETQGFKWQLGETCTEFALARVAEIGFAAKYDSPSDVISASTLEAASLKVIRYWKPKCELRAIFCVNYDDEGELIVGRAPTKIR